MNKPSQDGNIEKNDSTIKEATLQVHQNIYSKLSVDSLVRSHVK